MLGFFAPRVPAGGDSDQPIDRVVIDLPRWRSYIARLASSFSTPLPTLLDMPWDEALRWFPEVRAIYDETWGRGGGRNR